MNDNESQIVTDTSINSPENVTKFLQHCWQSTALHHQIATLNSDSGGFSNNPIISIDDAIVQAKTISEQGNDAYFALAEYITPDSRKADNVAGACCFWMDIDCGEDKAESGKGYLTKEEAKTALDEFCVKTGISQPGYIVDSGNGLHVYWMLDRHIERGVWKEHADKLKQLTNHFNFKADASRTSDITSVLRIPGTKNYKSTPKAVSFIKESSDLIESGSLLAAIDTAFSSLPESKADAKKSKATLPIPHTDNPDLERLKSALSKLDPDCTEEEWKLKRLAPLALHAKQFPGQAVEVEELARAWSRGDLAGVPSKAWVAISDSTGRTGKDEFAIQWQRFSDAEYDGNEVTVGSIYHAAKELGWTYGEQSELRALQDKFALIKLTGTIYLIDKEEIARKLTKSGQSGAVEFIRRQDASLLIARKLSELSSSNNISQITNSFFSSPSTKLYDGVVFDPVNNSDDYLNFWVGPTLQEKKGDWRKIKEFLREVICAGDEESYQYLIHYLAHAVQYPEDKPGVMVILLGGQGIGKGTFGRILQAIWGASCLQVSNVRDITGSFNGALSYSYIVFMDEAMFAGDRRASDALKSLVTEPRISINEKYQPSRSMNSYHRFIAATNAGHFKNTENDDRRDFVLQVAETYKGNHEYWKALNGEIIGSGTAAMLDELKNMSLSGFNVRLKPSTVALVDQKLKSLDHFGRWWYTCLDQGYCVPDDVVSLDDVAEGSWSTFISTETALQGVHTISGGRVFKNPIPKEVQQAIAKFCPSAEAKQRKENGRRKRGIALPELSVARSEFEQYIGGEIVWIEDELEDES